MSRLTAAPPPGAWTREQIESMLRSETFGYQRIVLPYGLSTLGEDRSQTANLVFPADLRGKTVLDVGCSYGFFSFEAKRRGAERVVGIDVDPEVIRKARILATILGLDVDFRSIDIEAEPLTERFDVVLALNLLHHMRDPLAALDAVGAATRDTLILEVASLSGRDRRRLGLGWLSAWMLSRNAVIVPGPSGPSFNRNVQRFYYTRKAIRNVLSQQHGWVARLTLKNSPHKERFIAFAERRRIDHLVLVTGPTSSGKSTLIEQLWRGELPDLADRIGMKDSVRWRAPINTNHLFEDSDPEQGNVIWHYDFLRPYYRTSKTYERDEALEALHCAKKITIVTVWTPPDRLKTQFLHSEIERRGKKRRNPESHHLKIQRQYEDPARILDLYSSWFSYARRYEADHVIATLEGECLTLRTLSEWEDIAVAARDA